MDFVFGEVNNDGYPDFAVAQQNGSVYLNNGNGNFTLALSGYTDGPDFGDIDGDGTDELSIINSSGGVEVWKWSDGNIWNSVTTGLPASGSYESTQLYDMNMDGFVDVTAFGTGIVCIWLGDGTGNWTQATQFNLPSPGNFQAFKIDGDVDHNGYPDIILVDEEGTWINYQNHLRFFKENSPPDSLTSKPVYPSPNRKVNIASVQTLKWISEVPSGDSSWVKLELSINDTLGPWHLVKDGLKNNGHYQWIVPGDMASNEKCRIRYTVYTLTDSAGAITSGGFYIIGEPVFLQETDIELPEEFILHQNYPNPFNPNTKIKFTIPNVIASEATQSQMVTLKVYDVLGNEVTTLVHEELPPGEYEVEFNANELSSGIYFYKLQAGGYIETKKMVLIK